MQQTVKIYQANKTVRKTFKTEKEAIEYIDKKGLHPAIAGEPIKLEISKVKYKSIKRDFPALSKDNKQILINFLFYNFNQINFSKFSIGVQMFRMYDKKCNKSKNILKCACFDYIKDYYGYTDKEMYDNFRDDNYMNKSYPQNRIDYPELFDKKLHEKNVPKIIKPALEKYDINDIKFKYNSTNYKPCNNISIEFSDSADDKYNNEIFQIRQSNILYDYGGHRCYGRNVSLLKTVDLTDEIFDKFFKTLNI